MQYNDGMDLKLDKDEVYALDAIDMGMNIPDDKYNNVKDENFKLFPLECMNNEVYKIVKNTKRTIAVSSMGWVGYLVYNIKKKEFEWKFTKGILDKRPKSLTKNYYVIRFPTGKTTYKVDWIVLETFVGKRDIILNPVGRYYHVDYLHNYIKDPISKKVYAEDDSDIGFGIRCCHLNSIYEDNRLVNLMWLTRSEERLLHTINGNVHFGHSNMETIIYTKEDNMPVYGAESVRKAGEWLGLKGNGGTVVTDNKHKLEVGEDITVNGIVYYCEYYLNLDSKEKIRVDKILGRIKLFYDDYNYKNINYNMEEHRIEAEAELERKRLEFEVFTPYIRNRWKILTGISCELNFKAQITDR